MFEQLGALPGYMVDIDEPRTPGVLENAAEQLLSSLDRAGPQIVAVEVHLIESEVGESLGPALSDGVLQVTDMGYAPIVWDRDFSIQNQLPAGREQPIEGCPKQRRAIATVPADQLEPAAAIEDRGEPVAVVLDLMKPAEPLGRAFRRRDDGEADTTG
jgi:hypothetical protein